MATSNGDAPRYVQLAKELTTRIATGVYPVGGELPTEVQLATEFSTSRFTVREALRHLEVSRMITRRQGSGSQVISSRPLSAYSLAVASDADLLRYGDETVASWTVHDRVMSRPVAELLELDDPEDWLWLSNLRRRASDGVKIGYSEVAVRREFVSSAKELGPEYFGTLFERICADHGLNVLHIDHVIKSVLIPPTLARRLSTGPNGPGLRVIRRFVAEGGAFEVTATTYPADRFQYGIRLDRAEPQKGRRVET